MAPEIILDKKYDMTVDWWAMGILLFEMLYGQLPFRESNQHKLFERIIKEEIVFPTHVGQGEKHREIAVSDEAKNLILMLLKKNPE